MTMVVKEEGDSRALEGLLKDKSSSIITDVNSRSTNTLITFGGHAGEFNMPFFEFSKITSPLDVKKIFVRDFEQSWYHRGLPGTSDDIDATASYLLEETRRLGEGRVIMCGNSMGGYAAILFGWLLNADVVLSFSPQTFIDRFSRLVHRDRRWKEQIKRVYSATSSRADYFDLSKVIGRGERGVKKTRYEVYYSEGMRLDRVHALKLKDIENVELHGFSKTGHELVKVLRERGLLFDIIKNALSKRTP